MTTSTPNSKETPPAGGQVANLAPKAKTIRQQGLWAMAWGRLRKHKLAMIGLVLLVTIILMVLLADWVAPYSYEEIDLNQSFSPLFAPGAEGRPIHILGTDKLGRDIFSRIVFAGRISLLVALVVTALDVFNGTIIGSVAGSFGGSVDTLLMRFADVMLTLPELPLLLVLSSSLRQFVQLQEFLGSSLSVIIIIFVLVMFGWMGLSRLVRGSVLSLRGMEFIEASRALGASRSHIIFNHLVPNSLAPIIVAATLGFGGVIISESALSFLGFGVMPPIPTWGNMLNEARSSPLEFLFTQALSPGFCIFLTVLSINFIGDGLRDALDPRLHT